MEGGVSHSVSLCLTIDDKEPDSVKGVFTDEEWLSLRDYARFAHVFLSTGLLAGTSDLSWSLRWSRRSAVLSGDGIRDYEALAVTLHRARPH
jgi:hypothetical protein